MKIALKKGTAAILASTLRRFRFTGRVLESDRLVYCLSSMYWRRGSIRCEGWCFHRDRNVSGVSLGWLGRGNWHFLKCSYGRARGLVGEQYPDIPSSSHSGFTVHASLPVQRFSGICLRVLFVDGTYQQVHLGGRGRVILEIALRSRWYTLQQVRRFGWRSLLHFPLHSRAFGKFIFTFRVHGALLIVDHALRGGANYYRDALVRARRRTGEPTLLLCYDYSALTYWVQYVHGNSEYTFTFDSPDALIDHIRDGHVGEILVNNLVSFPDPLGLARWLLAVRQALGARLVVAVHEYSWVCPSFNLIDYHGTYCGVPDRSTCRLCLGQNGYSWFEFEDIDLWRTVWGDFLAQATRILCFSRSSVALLRRAYPSLDVSKMAVQPHTLEYFSPRPVHLNLSAALNIGIVGGIDEIKGAGIIREIARLVEARGLPVKITVIGSMNMYRSSASSVVRILGRYEREHLPDIVESSGANLFFIPSIWPETFSYVTEELIQLGVPLVVFDLGAQAERVRAYSKGAVIPKVSAEVALNHLIDFHGRLLGGGAPH